jgi:hypothetical protein
MDLNFKEAELVRYFFIVAQIFFQLNELEQLLFKIYNILIILLELRELVWINLFNLRFETLLAARHGFYASFALDKMVFGTN